MAPAPVLLLDGGLGTALEDAYGVTFGPDTPLWSSHLLLDGRQDLLLACQQDFGCVPVDIVSTATYQLSTEALARTPAPGHPNGVASEHVTPFLESALATAEAAASPGAAIALSLGPYGASMIPSQEYSGQYDIQLLADLHRWHADRIRLFDSVRDLASRVAFVAFETVPKRQEIMAIRQLFPRGRDSSASEKAPAVAASPIPFWISFVFPGDGDTLPDGSDIRQVVMECLDAQCPFAVPWGIGINCTKVGKLARLVGQFEQAIFEMVASGSLREWPSLVLYPDGTNGEVYDTVSQTWRLPEGQAASTSPWARQVADVVTATRQRGHWRSIIVGGCCKASSDHIRDLRETGAQSGWFPNGAG